MDKETFKKAAMLRRDINNLQYEVEKGRGNEYRKEIGEKIFEYNRDCNKKGIKPSGDWVCKVSDYEVKEIYDNLPNDKKAEIINLIIDAWDRYCGEMCFEIRKLEKEFEKL